ncbi:HNH endonuclease [Kribbella sp. VKM Ac-2566]|nr:HNH endonuclease [Kribbella sp. VKM Ac-2566]
MIEYMSECPVEQPADEASGPSGAPVGRALSAVPSAPGAAIADEAGRGWDAPFLALVDRVRADARLAARHGLLGRYDDPDDRGAGLFEAVAFQDTSELSDSGWLDRHEAICRLEARLAAMKAEATAGYETSLHGVSADLGHRHPAPGDRVAEPGERRWVAGDLRSTADELALVWQMHKGAAMARIHTSCELVHNFPATLRALEEGQLTERAAFTIVRELSVLDDPDALRAAETALLGWAGKHPLQKLKQEAQREAARRSPDARSKAHARAMDERSVRIFPNSDGTAELVHTHDALDAGAVMNSLTRAAAYQRRQGDSRSMDQLRADIALQRLLPRTDTRRGREPGEDAVVEVPDDSTAGADATVVIHATGAEVRALIDGENSTGGTAEHYGPIPQESLRKHLTRALARSLLGGAGRSRIGLRLSDEPPAGKPDRYTPDAATDRFVRLRDRTCQFPGCNQPAEFADVDHRVAFAEGGRTTTDNLHCLCRHHHRLKHEGGWVVTSDPDGTTIWVSPTGRRYRTPAPDRGGSDPPDPDPPR